MQPPTHSLQCLSCFGHEGLEFILTCTGHVAYPSEVQQTNKNRLSHLQAAKEFQFILTAYLWTVGGNTDRGRTCKLQIKDPVRTNETILHQKHCIIITGFSFFFQPHQQRGSKDGKVWWSISPLLTEISQQLFDGFPWNFLQIFMVHRGGFLITLVIS